MRVPRKVYVIYPFTNSGEIAGAYIGSSWNVVLRLRNHICCTATKAHEEFHDLMRRNGYAWQELDDIPTFSDRYKEYAWIDFFKKQNVRVFNSQIGKNADQKTIYRNGKAPIWTGEKIIWGN